MTALIRYDAARKAIAAAHRVDEVKAIRDKMEALRVYAQQAGDYELQNRAAEIRLRAERRAGELLLDMQATGQRQAKNRGRPAKVSCSTTLPKLGITRDQSSRWQQLARKVDEVTFEKALIQARERYGEITTSAVLREIKDVIRPAGCVVEPNINTIAVELVRDIESANRKDRLRAVVESRGRLNPTIRRSLIRALLNSRKDAAKFARQLSQDFVEFPANGKAYQRLIREHMATQPEPDLEEKQRFAVSLQHATVKQIDYDSAKNFILTFEWCGNLGTSEHCYGLFFGRHLGGVVCFGSVAGSNVRSSVCGSEHTDKVVNLVRGATAFWSHPHSGSFLISAACREMTKKGFHVFVAYADPEAGERGVLYRACNFLFCGTSNPTEKFRTPDGKIHDARQVHGLTRDRTNRMLRYKRSRAAQKKLLIENGSEFFKNRTGKLRFVGIFGDRRIKKILRRALRWEVMPYPRESSTETRVRVPDVEPVAKAFAASVG